MELYRLAKFISHAGYCSRRYAEQLIESGSVTVNGDVIKNCATKVSVDDKVVINDIRISLDEKPRLWIYNKPKEVITTHYDPEGRRSVFNELPKELPRVISIGRLDYNSEGLLLLTNSPKLAHLLENPKLSLERVYKCRVFGNIPNDMKIKAANGLNIAGINYRPIKIKIISSENRDNNWLLITLTEGKNREIRKVMKFFGLEVSRLIRISYGKFCLNDIEKNSIIELRRSDFEEYLS
jgi:23S rRNA pseudouridine2605 synthase